MQLVLNPEFDRVERIAGLLFGLGLSLDLIRRYRKCIRRYSKEHPKSDLHVSYSKEHPKSDLHVSYLLFL